MSAKRGISPFELLLDIDTRSRHHSSGFPEAQNNRREWVGIGFEVSNAHLLAPMSEVSEVVLPPKVAPVPGVKPWVLGIANMRGNLLPIMDLHGFLYGGNQAEERNQRVLVVSYAAVTAGLLVDAVMGLKHFWIEEETDELPRIDDELAPFVESAYQRSNEHFAVFNVAKLIQSELFLDIAV